MNTITKFLTITLFLSSAYLCKGITSIELQKLNTAKKDLNSLLKKDTTSMDATALKNWQDNINAQQDIVKKYDNPSNITQMEQSIKRSISKSTTGSSTIFISDIKKSIEVITNLALNNDDFYINLETIIDDTKKVTLQITQALATNVITQQEHDDLDELVQTLKNDLQVQSVTLISQVLNDTQTIAQNQIDSLQTALGKGDKRKFFFSEVNSGNEASTDNIVKGIAKLSDKYQLNNNLVNVVYGFIKTSEQEELNVNIKNLMRSLLDLLNEYNQFITYFAGKLSVDGNYLSQDQKDYLNGDFKTNVVTKLNNVAIIIDESFQSYYDQDIKEIKIDIETSHEILINQAW